MDLRQLKYFAKVGELKSLTHAAEALNVTQPALGMQMRKLEAYLGVDLIERHSRGVRLTEAGMALHKRAIDIIERVEAAKLDARRYGKDAIGTVRIGVNPSAGRVIVPSLLQECSDKHPTINLQLTQAFADDLAIDIQERKLDFAITHLAIETDHLESLPLYVERFMLIGTPDLVGALPDPIEVATLASLPLALDGRSQYLRRLLDSSLAVAGLSFRNTQEILAFSLRRELVSQGRRCTIGTRALFQRELDNGELVGRKLTIPNLELDMHLTTRLVEAMTPAEAAVRQLIVSLVDDAIARGDVGWSLPRG